jgi:hypothetical protein
MTLYTHNQLAGMDRFSIQALTHRFGRHQSVEPLLEDKTSQQIHTIDQ